MKKFMSKFVLRGLVSMGFGPFVYATVVLILQLCNVHVLEDGISIFKAILSTSLVAFICGGMSSIWQEERLGIGFLILIHGASLYVSYLLMYLINNWILKEDMIVFSIIFIVGYLLIWSIIYFIEKNRAKKLNKEFRLR